MWKKKKFILVAVIVAVLLVGGIAGVAIAQSTNGGGSNNSTTQTGQSFVARVAAILGLQQSQVQSAFDQAQKDMANQAMQNRLNNLVQQGKISSDQANQYEQWYQSRPDINLPGMSPNGPGGPGRFGRFGGFWMQKGTAPTTPPPTTATPSTGS